VDQEITSLFNQSRKASAMKLRHILIVICILIPIIAQAGNTRPGNYSRTEYWIVGSFMMENRAMIEGKRIQQETGFEVKLLPATVNGQPHFRVVVVISASDAERNLQKKAFAEAGIVGAWALHPHVLDTDLLALDGSSARKAPVVAAAPVRPATPVSAAPVATAPSAPATPSAEDLAAMQMKHSYLDFCMNKATLSQRIQYCRNQDFAAAVRQMSELSPEYRAFVEFCTSRANLSQRQSMCNNKDFIDQSSTAG
jgi:hypothetical protein